MTKGLAPHTSTIFHEVARLDCIKPYTLVGGTALSLQLANRLSEDLDFMSWRTSVSERREVDWPRIKKELETIGRLTSCDILDIDHVEFAINNVKISFYANPHRSPLKDRIHLSDNLYIADRTAIGAMKMEVMLRRSKFRDYYDIYSLLQAGESITEMIDIALRYSDHKLKSKNLIAMLTRGERFQRESGFGTLEPIYDVSAAEIERYIIGAIGAG